MKYIYKILCIFGIHKNEITSSEYMGGGWTIETLLCERCGYETKRYKIHEY